MLNDERMDKYAEADWKMKAAYHLVGGALTPCTPRWVRSASPSATPGWARERPEVDEDTQKRLITHMLQGRDRGSGTASKYLTDTTN